MADEPIYKGAEDEYSYSAASTTSDVFGAKQDNQFSSGLSALVGRLAVVAVVAFIGFAAYKLYGHYILAKGNSLASKTVEQIVAKPVAEPATPVMTPPIPVSAPVAEMNTRVSQLESQAATRNDDMQNLQNTITQLQSDMSSLRSNMDSMQQTLQQVNTQNQQLTAQLAKAKRPAVMPKKIVHHTPATHEVVRTMRYYLQASIPGRAWLMGEDGSTVTVAEGDNLRGYGFIRRIDPVKGKVFTSSGMTIRFNEGD